MISIILVGDYRWYFQSDRVEARTEGTTPLRQSMKYGTGRFAVRPVVGATPIKTVDEVNSSPARWCSPMFCKRAECYSAGRSTQANLCSDRSSSLPWSVAWR